MNNINFGSYSLSDGIVKKFSVSNGTHESTKEKVKPLSVQEREIEHMKERLEHNKECSAVAKLDAKVKMGQVLSKEEIEYLKENEPKIYENWKEIERERKAIEKELKNARSEEDVDNIKNRRVSQYNSELKDVQQSSMGIEAKREASEQIGAKLMTLLDLYNKFIKTSSNKNKSEDEESIVKKRRDEETSQIDVSI